MSKKICQVEGCENEVRTHKYGELCLLHYKRFVRYGSVDLPEKEFESEKKCKYCDRKIGEKGGGARGMCNKHYQNWRRYGDALFSDKKYLKPGKYGYNKTNKHQTSNHRKIYENYIGRKLKRNEIIHHIDLIKTNNDIRNLHYCKTRSEHSFLHRQLENIAGELYRIGIIGFKDGKYYIK